VRTKMMMLIRRILGWNTVSGKKQTAVSIRWIKVPLRAAFWIRRATRNSNFISLLPLQLLGMTRPHESKTSSRSSSTQIRMDMISGPT
jgi:hypothetical protein